LIIKEFTVSFNSVVSLLPVLAAERASVCVDGFQSSPWRQRGHFVCVEVWTRMHTFPQSRQQHQKFLSETSILKESWSWRLRETWYVLYHVPDMDRVQPRGTAFRQYAFLALPYRCLECAALHDFEAPLHRGASQASFHL